MRRAKLSSQLGTQIEKMPQSILQHEKSKCHADTLFATVTTLTTMCGIRESLSVQLAKEKLERR